MTHEELSPEDFSFSTVINTSEEISDLRQSRRFGM
jgi:hypothetical protein